MAGYVFVSYSRRDSAYVDRLVSHLRARELDVWDDGKIQYGNKWASVIRDKVDGCSAFVVVMTPDAEESDWVGREITRAQGERKPILPLLLSGKPFMRLNDIHYENVRGEAMPSAEFVARLHSLTFGHSMATPHPAGEHVPDAKHSLPRQVGPRQLRRDWLPFVLLDGRRLVFHVVEGEVSSSVDGWVRVWRSLGGAVSRLVASQDGSYLVAQSEHGVVVAHVDEASQVKALPPVPVGPGEIRLVAARHKQPRSVHEYSVVEALVGTATAGEIWVISERGLHSKRALTGPIRAGAGTDDGFLVVGLDGAMAQVSPDSGESTVLAELGGGWVDVDAAISPYGGVYAALRRAGATTTASHAHSVDQLAETPRTAGNHVVAVRVNRRLGTQSGVPRCADLSAEVWLVSADAQVSLATRPPVVSATGRQVAE